MALCLAMTGVAPAHSVGDALSLGLAVTDGHGADFQLDELAVTRGSQPVNASESIFCQVEEVEPVSRN